jgi:hypothetical protein
MNINALWLGKSNICGGVTSIIAPNGTGLYAELTSKSNTERVIMKENESKYRQASHTPFMLPPLLGDFGYLGIRAHTHSIMHGEYETPPPPDVDLYTAKFIAHLHMEPKIQQAPPIPVFFTTEEWKAGWKKIKERTATGSDFIHFGHFKAGCTNEITAYFKATMANIPLLSGYSPKHWQKQSTACYSNGKVILKWTNSRPLSSLTLRPITILSFLEER